MGERTIALYNGDGTPKVDATPDFLVGGDGAKDYRSVSGPRVAPAISLIRDNIYGFTFSDADERAGVGYVIDAGVDASPRFISGAIHPYDQPFGVLFFTDGAGGVWAGPVPQVAVYAAIDGALRTPPDLKLLSGTYLSLLVPSAEDLSIGVVYRVDADLGASPQSIAGRLAAPVARLSITKQSLLDRFPELCEEPSLSEFVWSELLADVAMEIYVPAWLNQDAADRAALWLLAHFVALEKKRLQNGLAGATVPGPLKSITVGPVTKTWESSAANSSESKGEYSEDSMLERTEYGREYMRLRKRLCRLRKR